MSSWALVPVKARAEGKTRLSGVLSPEARAALVRDMLRHVLEVLRASPGIDHVAVVSPERDEVPPDVLVLNEQGLGLNPTLGSAVATLKSMGAREVVIVPADLPRLKTRDVELLLAGVRSAGCALASDWRGLGTNAIALDMQLLRDIAFRFSFGEGSFARHRQEASALGLGPKLVRGTGLAFDLDEPRDLRLVDWGMKRRAG
jgi:2-phospho-L-lactate guanylyltransferase